MDDTISDVTKLIKQKAGAVDRIAPICVLPTLGTNASNHALRQSFKAHLAPNGRERMTIIQFYGLSGD